MLKPGPTVLIVDDDIEVATSHARMVLDLGYRTLTESNPEAVESLLERAPEVSIVLLDVRMPRLNGLELLMRIRLRRPEVGVVMATVVNDVEHAVRAIKSGAYNYLLKPLQADRVGRVLESWFGSRSAPPTDDAEFRGLITGAASLREIFARVRALAGTDVTVLLGGETGTGKELVAERLHALSARRAGPFVPVNVAALSPPLFESELFGHRAGAFTGATQDHPGYFGTAAGGTLFLDEIGEISPESQTKFLRVVQSRRYCRVGEAVERPLEARLVVATNRDLAAAVRDGDFREDLYYRLSSHAVLLPPLRDRPGDVGLLSRYFLEKYSCQYGRTIRSLDPETMRCLEKHLWPGNVRELEGIMSMAVLVEKSDRLTPDSLPEHVRIGTKTGQNLEAVRYQAVMQALAACGGNQTKAADRLGISRVTLNRWLKQYRERSNSA